MNRIRIRTFAGASAIALLFAAAPARAQHMGGPRGGRGRECQAQLNQAVGLTDAQQTALTALREQTRTSIKTVEASAQDLHQQIETALSASSPDPTAIGKLMIQGYALHQQIDGIRKSAEAAFVASLPSDQQAKYATFIAAHPGCAAFPEHMLRPGRPPA